MNRASFQLGSGSSNTGASAGGLLIINADDWGLDRLTTDRILACALRRRVSTVSAMVFMEDSERAAEVSRESGVYAGLHLNLTTPFSSKNSPIALAEKQREITAAVRRNRFSKGLFHPQLRRHFEYVVAAQLEEFQRLYGAPATRIDGHHHMHLCPNVLLTGLLPAGTTVRRSFSFKRGEKGAFNRFYRSMVDRILARRHVLTDFFFNLAPLQPLTRVREILSLARTFTVEVETHPALIEEHDFLVSDEMSRLTENIRMAFPQYAAGSPIAPA